MSRARAGACRNVALGGWCVYYLFRGQVPPFVLPVISKRILHEELTHAYGSYTYTHLTEVRAMTRPARTGRTLGWRYHCQGQLAEGGAAWVCVGGICRVGCRGLMRSDQAALRRNRMRFVHGSCAWVVNLRYGAFVGFEAPIG